jgi:hypothetical protein
MHQIWCWRLPIKCGHYAVGSACTFSLTHFYFYLDSP